LLRGWAPFFRLSVGLGLRSFLRGRFTREALIRVVAPLEDTRLFELPATVASLDVAPGERVLDLASPKLAAVWLARHGATVTSVDLLEAEIARWRELAGHVRGLEFDVADARRLPFADESFDHAYSISVIEHIGNDGDFEALAELARVVKPGGRIVLTVPFDATYREDWRERPLYGPGDAQPDGRSFFARTYDDARLDRLIAATPSVREVERRRVRFSSTRLSRFYYRAHPASLVLGPLLALSSREIEGPGGLALVTFVRAALPGHPPSG
jgi:SAM-dependent methyltransferase